MQIAAIPQNAAQEYARTAQLQQQTAASKQEMQQRSLEMQAQQRQLNDQDARTQTLTQFDPNKHSINDLPAMVVANGGSADAAQQLQQSIVTQKKNLMSLNDDQFKQEENKANLMQGVHDAVTQAKPEDKNSVYQAGMHRLGAAGVDVSKEPINYPGDDVFAQHLPPIQLHSAFVDQVAKDRQGQEAAAKAREANATAAHQEFVNSLTQNSKPGDFDKQIDSIIPPAGAQGQGQNQFVKAQVNGFIARGDIANANKAMEQAYQNQLGVQKDIAVATNPQIQQGKVDVATAEGKARAAIQNGAPIQIPKGATGEAALANLDPSTASAVRMIGDGKADFSTFTTRTTPQYRQQLAAAVAAYNPDFDQNTYKVRGAEERGFTSGTQGQQLTAIGTARNHMQTFKDTADALDNGDLLLANKVGNAIGMQFGSDKATNFNIAKSAFAGEVGKAFAGANVGVQDRQELMDKISAASSPAQLKGYADTADKLLEGKQKSLKQSYAQGVQNKPNFGGGGVTKTASQQHISDYATAKGISVQQATQEFKASGYTIQ